MLRQMAIKLKIILSICKYLSQDQIILIEIYPQLIRMLLDTNEKNTKCGFCAVLFALQRRQKFSLL